MKKYEEREEQIAGHTYLHEDSHFVLVHIGNALAEAKEGDCEVTMRQGQSCQLLIYNYTTGRWLLSGGLRRLPPTWRVAAKSGLAAGDLAQVHLGGWATSARLTNRGIRNLIAARRGQHVYGYGPQLRLIEEVIELIIFPPERPR